MTILSYDELLGTAAAQLHDKVLDISRRNDREGSLFCICAVVWQRNTKIAGVPYVSYVPPSADSNAGRTRSQIKANFESIPSFVCHQ